MEISRDSLQHALAVVKPGLANKEIMEQTTSFAFVDNRVITYNDALSISHPVDGLHITGAIKADELYGLLSRLSKDSIEVTLADSELQLKCGRVKAGLRLESEILLPIDEEIGDISKWHELADPEEFTKHIKFAMQTCSGDIGQPKLTVVCIRKNGLVQGSDGFRLAQCKGKPLKFLTEDEFMLPATAATEVVKTFPTHINLTRRWVHFKNAEGTIISCRILGIEYFEQSRIDALLDVDSIEELSFPRKVQDMLDRVRQIAKRDFAFDEEVYVSISGGKIKMRAEAETTKSWVEEEATMSHKEEVAFRITPLLFDDILKETRVCNISSEMDKLKFMAEDESWEYIVSLSKSHKQ